MKLKKKVVPFEKTAYYKKMEARVERGIKWLDKVWPGRAWVKQVKPSVLNMVNPNTCVLGQAFGSYWNKVARSGPGYGDLISEKVAISYGFQTKLSYSKLVSHEKRIEQQQRDYDTLGFIWKARLTQMRAR